MRQGGFMIQNEQFRLFPKHVLHGIACEFIEYFKRKEHRKLTLKDAATMIDYVAGPAPRSMGMKSTSIALTQGKGGGRPRPTAMQIEEIFNRHYHDLDIHDWDSVFDELIEVHKKQRETMSLIYLTFRDKHSWYVICDELNVSMASYYRQRHRILEFAGYIATKKALLSIANTDISF